MPSRVRAMVSSLLHALRNPKERQRMWIEHRRDAMRFAALAFVALMLVVAVAVLVRPSSEQGGDGGVDDASRTDASRDPLLLAAPLAAALAPAPVPVPVPAALESDTLSIDIDDQPPPPPPPAPNDPLPPSGGAVGTEADVIDLDDGETEHGEKSEEVRAPVVEVSQQPPQPQQPSQVDADIEIASRVMPERLDHQVDSEVEEAQPAPTIELQPIDPPPSELAADAQPPPPPVVEENRFGSAARSRISRISRVVEQADLDRMAAEAKAAGSSSDDRPAAGPEFDSLEQSALDRWQNTNYTRRAEKYARSGFINSEGVFVPPSDGAGGPGWNRADMSNLTLVWDFGGGGCSGWGLEATNMVLSLVGHVGRIGIVAGWDSWCKGLPDSALQTLESMRTAPINEWDVVDVFVSHKPPQRYPTFPYRGVTHINREPLFIIGRSMTEVHRISSEWTSRIARLVDEVWVPARHSLEAFESGGANSLQMRIVPEPIDAALYDPVHTRPLVVRGLRSFNFLSIFKLEERKGWKVLIRAWMEEFCETDPVTLTLHTYLFNEVDPRNERRIRRRIRHFVEEELEFPGRNLTARPLPFANLIVHAEETDTSDMPAFYAAYSAFVLPSHGEGWGMPLMEAMAMGLPTISTNWGGQLDFMSSRNSYLIPVERFEAADARFFDRGAKWAVPSLSALRRAMRHMVDHPDHTLPIAARGRAKVINKFNTASVGGVMLRRLQELHPIILERRNMRAEGRRIVRGSHLATSLGPSSGVAPSLPEGMMARRGDAAQEAAQAALQQEEQQLEAVVADSKRTGWQPDQAHAAADGVDDEGDDASAAPDELAQDPASLQQVPPQEQESSSISNMPTQAQEDQAASDAQAQPQQPQLHEKQQRQQAQADSMDDGNERDPPPRSTPSEPQTPTQNAGVDEQTDDPAATDAPRTLNGAIEAQAESPAADGAAGPAAPVAPLASDTPSAPEVLAPAPAPLADPALESLDASVGTDATDAADPFFSATDPSAPTPVSSSRAASPLPTPLSSGVDSPVDGDGGTDAAAEAAAEAAAAQLDARANGWRDKLRGKLSSMAAGAAAAADRVDSEEAQLLGGGVVLAPGQSSTEGSNVGADAPAPEAPFTAGSIAPAAATDDEQVSPSVVIDADREPKQSSSQAQDAPAPVSVPASMDAQAPTPHAPAAETQAAAQPAAATIEVVSADPDAETEEQSEARRIALAMASKYAHKSQQYEPESASARKSKSRKAGAAARRDEQPLWQRRNERKETEHTVIPDAPRRSNSQQSSHKVQAIPRRPRRSTSAERASKPAPAAAAVDDEAPGRFQPSVHASKRRRQRQAQAQAQREDQDDANDAVVAAPQVRKQKRQKRQPQQQRQRPQQPQQASQPPAGMKARRRQRRRDAQEEN